MHSIDSLDAAKQAARKMHTDVHAVLQAPRKAMSTLRVVIPSMEYCDIELQTTSRSFHSSRALWNLLAVARNPNQKLVLVNGPRLPTEVEAFYLGLLPVANAREAVDRSGRTYILQRPMGNGDRLSDIMLAHPDLLDTISSIIAAERAAGTHIEGLDCFFSSARMETLAKALRLPLMQADASKLWWGSKAGSRTLFQRAAVHHAAGTHESSFSMPALALTIAELQEQHPCTMKWMVKINQSCGGSGNAVFTWPTLPPVVDSVVDSIVDSVVDSVVDNREMLVQAAEDALAHLEFADSTMTPQRFATALYTYGGIVEQFLMPHPLGLAVRTPSAQGLVYRAPDGVIRYKILSTHDQIMDPRNGQSFMGCKFPADMNYRRELKESGERVLAELAKEGVMGNAAIDFLAIPDVNIKGDITWKLFALEINTRQSGTTHPFMTAQLLTGGELDADGNFLDLQGRPRCYTSIERHYGDDWFDLTGSEVIVALNARPDLKFDPYTNTGVVPHQWSTLPPFGEIGALAIAATQDEAAQLQERFFQLMEDLAVQKQVRVCSSKSSL